MASLPVDLLITRLIARAATLWDLSVDPVRDLIIIGLAGPILVGWLIRFQKFVWLLYRILCILSN